MSATVSAFGSVAPPRIGIANQPMSGTNFFDFRENLYRKGETAPARSDPAQAMTITQLTGMIDKAMKAGVPASVLVRGEASNLNHHRGSGHIYFTLKDTGSCIDCVMFKSDAAKLKFEPGDGQELLARGRVAIYAQRGRYQLYVSRLDPIGQGALELAFQQLKAKLEHEGLFAPERKKDLPNFPVNVVIVTSRQTAALQDILKVLRRFSFLRLSVFHVPVQGDGSAEKIADAIGALNRQAVKRRIPADLILLARGGGSLEDLWEFNEEVVARAIAASTIPIISGIGHEVDVSIADLVADYHAHTPTEAAQIVVRNWRGVDESIALSSVRLTRAARQLIADATQRLVAIERHEVFRRPMDRINQLRQLLDDRQRSMSLAVSERLRSATARLERMQAMQIERHPRHRINLSKQRMVLLRTRLLAIASRDLERRKSRVDSIDAQLRALSPQGVLQRGYSITTLKKTGAIVRAAADVRNGEKLLTRFSDGEVESMVQDSKQMSLFE